HKLVSPVIVYLKTSLNISNAFVFTLFFYILSLKAIVSNNDLCSELLRNLCFLPGYIYSRLSCSVFRILKYYYFIY
ncbi:MAG TPA: hypothetical protein DCY06_13805, partial [Bacteroidetes bacterium]|nr:hypothetical protein [Bacteroidota bacterium]